MAMIILATVANLTFEYILHRAKFDIDAIFTSSTPSRCLNFFFDRTPPRHFILKRQRAANSTSVRSSMFQRETNYGDIVA